MQENKTYSSILVIVLGLSIISLIFDISWLNIVGLGIGGISILSKYIADKISLYWYKLALLLGKINGTILLTIIFVLLVIPLSFLRRLFGAKAEMNDDSSFKDRDHTYGKADFENPW